MNDRHLRAIAAVALVWSATIAGCGRATGVSSTAGGHASAEAVAELVRGLSLPDPAARARAAEAIGRIGPGAKAAVPALTKALQDRDLSVRAAAAYTLGEIGPDARGAIPNLERLTRPSTLRDVATRAIEKIGR